MRKLFFVFNVRKSFLLLCLSFFLPPLFSQPNEGVVSVRDKDPSLPVVSRTAGDEVPELLRGIWQGSDRLVMFSLDNQFSLVLRVFYQWYSDRASEPASFREIKSRDRNNATKSSADEINLKFITVYENSSKTAGVYEISVKYPGEKESVLIPVCVIEGKLYLDFLIKNSAADTDSQINSEKQDKSGQKENSENKKDGFYRAASSASGITISAPVFKKEVVSYLLNGKDIYRIRYWLSEMEYSYAKASFTDEDNGGKTFLVDKFLRIGTDVFQCTTGRSSKIRNVEKVSVPQKETALDDSGEIIAFGKPYLIFVPGSGTENDSEILLSNVEKSNRLKKKAPAPLFHVSEIDFHWKEISELEKYNPYTWNRRNLDVHK